MIDPRLAWFAIGASCSAVMFGWPWHPRFSRFNRRMGPPKGSYGLPPNHSWRVIRSITFPDPEPGRQPTNPFTGDLVRLELHEGRVQRGNGNGGPTTPKPAIVPSGQTRRTARWFINNPVTIAECGGPCTQGPSHCDCGLLWHDVPIEPQFPSRRVIP